MRIQFTSMSSETKAETQAQSVAAAATQIPTVTLEHNSGKAKVVVSLLGATIMEWRIFNTDMLFLSSNYVRDGSRPIRGGMPLVFPQFGPGKMPQHGFARTEMWEHVENFIDMESGDTIGTFRLVANERTKAMWPYDFELRFNIRLGLSKLQTELVVKNTGTEAFSFDALFHTYFRVDSIKNARVEGLLNIPYIDKVAKGAAKIQRAPTLAFDGQEVDRVYHRGGQLDKSGRPRTSEMLYVGDSGNAEVAIAATGLDDVVVWNPGKAKSDALPDMEPDGYDKFVCVELGQVRDKPTLGAGQTWRGVQAFVLNILSGAAAQAAKLRKNESQATEDPEASTEVQGDSKTEGDSSL